MFSKPGTVAIPQSDDIFSNNDTMCCYQRHFSSVCKLYFWLKTLKVYVQRYFYSWFFFRAPKGLSDDRGSRPEVFLKIS